MPVQSLWRNRLARSAVNRKVGGSSPPRDVALFWARGHDTLVAKSRGKKSAQVWRPFHWREKQEGPLSGYGTVVSSRRIRLPRWEEEEEGCQMAHKLARTGIEPATLALLAPRSNQLS